jgi:hypothetical protein
MLLTHDSFGEFVWVDEWGIKRAIYILANAVYTPTITNKHNWGGPTLQGLW